MPIDPTIRLEVLISSQMGTARWNSLWTSARRSISSTGFAPIDFEGIAPGPIEGGLGPGDLGVRLASRADMIVAIIGSTVTDAVHREIQAALDRSPCPPIGVFFDSTVIRDERAESARNELRDLTVFGDFRSVVGLRRHVSSFLAQKVHLARRNRASPVLLSKERIVVAPGEEERRSFLMIGGDTIIAYAQAIKPDLFLARQRFHLGLFSSSEFVQRTESTPYTRFDVASERYSFEQSLSAERAGYCYVVVRRPWWFQLGRATVDLTILLSRLGT